MSKGFEEIENKEDEINFLKFMNENMDFLEILYIEKFTRTNYLINKYLQDLSAINNKKEYDDIQCETYRGKNMPRFRNYEDKILSDKYEKIQDFYRNTFNSLPQNERNLSALNCTNKKRLIEGIIEYLTYYDYKTMIEVMEKYEKLNAEIEEEARFKNKYGRM